MAKKPTKKKTTAKKKARKPSVKKSTARKPRLAKLPAAAKRKSRPATKTKKQRVDGAIGALDEVLHGIGAERAERIRQRVRSVLASFR